jgi:hypothetical protein
VFELNKKYKIQDRKSYMEVVEGKGGYDRAREDSDSKRREYCIR